MAAFTDCAAMWADPVVTRYIGGRPLTGEEVWARMLRYAGHWSWMGYGYWAVEEKSSGGFVGEVGFAEYKRELKPSIQGVPELGWVFVTSARGKGYATEAVRAALAWGESRFPAQRTVCIINPENLASIRVAEKCGYQESQRATYNGRPIILFARHPV